MAATEASSQGTPTRRGRPRSFDRDEALGQALKVFQANGYEGTSMTQLVDAMGIVSPSIYAAFGSKEDLFREAVGLYQSRTVEPIWAELERNADVRQAVQTLLFASIELFTSTGVQHGCLVMLGTAHLGGSDASVRAFLRQQRQTFKSRLAIRFDQAVRTGDLPPDSDPETLAECVLAFFGGLAIESVDGTESTILERSARLFCNRILK